MPIDLHIHSKDGSDGMLHVKEIFKMAYLKKIDLLSITDHDSVIAQEESWELALKYGIRYITGVELNITISHPKYNQGKEISLDFLGYNFSINDKPLKERLTFIRNYRKKRAGKILENINHELYKEGIEGISDKDLLGIKSDEGSLGRPHIAQILIKKHIVKDRAEAFDKYLTKCNEPKYKLSLEEAASLIHRAGGKIILAHPNDPRGTSLKKFTDSLYMQSEIVYDIIINFIDGIECWHSRHDPETVKFYLEFAKKNNLMVTGGSDCHQNPIIMGTIDIPDFVGRQFEKWML
ncbi:MAG: PHP domain-containing protein [Thermodesulfobacteriota bacterium]|nr:PHP domain-containing protein [Thermodesulfobacteriota bacterium]